MLVGSPGIGKSAVIHELARKWNLKVIDFRLAQADPTDMLGFPNIDLERGKACYYPFDTFPLEGDEIPINPETGEQYAGWLIFYDEMNSADRGVQKAAYKVIQDKMVGNQKLHPNCVQIAAGNLASDGAIVEETSSALASRIQHYHMISDAPGWLEWASANNIDYRIRAHIEFDNANLNTFDPKLLNRGEDKTFPCERTWHNLSKKLAFFELDEPHAIICAAATISEGMARQFISWTKIYDTLPTFSEILADPTGAVLPNNPSGQYAITGMLASNTTASNAGTALNYLDRLPAEYQTTCMMDMLKRKPELTTHPEIVEWISTNALEFF
jgi:hypothetical protein